MAQIQPQKMRLGEKDWKQRMWERVKNKMNKGHMQRERYYGVEK